MRARSKRKRDEIVIIGYGAFGQLAARWLKKYFRVSITDERQIRHAPAGIRVLRRNEAPSGTIYLLAVPINRLRAVLRSISPHLKPGTLVIDVCSVKEQPVKWMRDILPPRVSILGTHPLFGPLSAGKSIRGHAIALCPVRMTRRKTERVSSFLRRGGLKVIRMTPRRHDRLMAATLFYTHFLGRGVLRSHLLITPLATAGYRSLARIALSVGLDSPELFRDMFRYNRFAHSIPRRVIRDFRAVQRQLQGGSS